MANLKKSKNNKKKSVPPLNEIDIEYLYTDIYPDWITKIEKINNLFKKNKTTDANLEYKNLLGQAFKELNSFLIKNYNIQISRDFIRKNFPSEYNHIIDFYATFGNFKKQSNIDLKIEDEQTDVENGLSTFKREDLINKPIEKNKHKKKTFFVSSIIPGFTINKKVLATIENFKKAKNAEIILLPMKGLYKDDFFTTEDYNAIADYIRHEYLFNSNLKALDILISPNQIIPLTGLDRFGQKEYSLIIASPKQQLKSVPVSPTKLPHLMHSTGTISDKDNSNYPANRIGRLGMQDHVLGGLIVEVVDDNLFHMRQIQFDNEGTMIDATEKFKPDTIKIEKVKAKAIVLGDSHFGWEDPKAFKTTFEQISYHEPEEIFLHDTYDGCSISHHAENNLFAQVNRPVHIDTLQKELDYVGSCLLKYVEAFPKLKINIVRSNHDEHLDRYLNEGRYVKDRFNHRLALQLAIYLLDGKNPIEEYLKQKFPKLNKLQFLKRDSSYTIKGVQLAAHGDLGKFTSVGRLENAFGQAVCGHAHTTQIFRGIWIVGTNSILNLPYIKGQPISWTHTNCVIYEDGRKQLLTTIDTKWKM